MNTLVVNIVLSAIIFNLAYRWFLKPALPRLDPAMVLGADADRGAHSHH